MLKQLIVVSVMIASAPPSSASLRLLCTENQGRACSSQTPCRAQRLPSTSLKIVLPEMVRVVKAQGTMQECQGKTCGDVNLVSGRELEGGGWSVRRLPADSMLIDGQTGFFTRSVLANGAHAGDAAISFGVCRRS
jgi:hypothetical protein